MNLSSNNTTIICPHNDAESITILEIAKHFFQDVRISQQSTWFCPLDMEPESTFIGLKENVVIIEMPSLSKEELLIQKGHNLIIIDHHGYPSLGISRESNTSSIEQFAQLIGYTLSHWERGISINDQLYIYGLIAHGYTEEEIRKIRELDLKCQGYTESDFKNALEDIHNGKKINSTTTLYQTSGLKYTYLIDLHILGQKGKFSNVVIFGETGDTRGKLIFFSGELKTIDALKTLGGYSKSSNNEYGLWGGYENGKEKVDLREALRIISDRKTVN